MAETEILLESGTNEIEIMEFTIYDELYGINVAKVREIMMSDHVKPVPHSHPAVEGIFKPRDIMLTVIDLPYYLTGNVTEYSAKDLFIITNFNKVYIAFRVHSVVGIQRLSWKAISKPDDTLSGKEASIATGIAQCDGRLITILDFEKIVSDIAPETGIQMSEIEAMGQRERSDKHVVLAEDSALLEQMIHEALHRAGYVNTHQFNNGKEAWQYLSAARDSGRLDGKADILITDLEMPEMDGHRLTKLVKDDPTLQNIPVVIFSSLINEEMERKGRQLGADAQLSKPEIGNLVRVLDELTERR